MKRCWCGEQEARGGLCHDHLPVCSVCGKTEIEDSTVSYRYYLELILCQADFAAMHKSVEAQGQEEDGSSITGSRSTICLPDN